MMVPMTDEKLQFMYVMRPTDPTKAASRDGWTDYDRETFELNLAHLHCAKGAGKLILAGRTLDSDGSGPAIVVFEADTEGEAQRFFKAEPFLTRGFCTATLHPFSNPVMRDSE
jgi:uncharacterized protein YciI